MDLYSNLPTSWQKPVKEEISEDVLKKLASFLQKERAIAEVYPPKGSVFSVFEQTSFEEVKVVIMGQDPYHGPFQAHGLSFSVPEGVAIPPSLLNIYKEIKSDLGIEPPKTGSLDYLAQQGVLLLNAILTVRKAEPMSHHGKGWEEFTDGIIAALAKREDPVIFVLWGRAAARKCESVFSKIDKKQYILKAAHPSPYSAYSGFLGCRHFSQINQLLESFGKEKISWGAPAKAPV